MKCSLRSGCSQKAGFTLIELLVVIAIIAILAAVTISGVTSAMNAAKRAKALNNATQIQNAILAYYTEYGVYPVSQTAATGTSNDTYYSEANAPSQQDLMYALCGNINASTGAASSYTGSIPNARLIAFITPKRSDVDPNDGILINPFFTPATALAGGVFNILIDTDYDGVAGDSVGVSPGGLPDFTNWTSGKPISYIATGAKNEGITQGVAVWANCDTKHLPAGGDAQSTTPGFWIHTY
jgi:prepilin-type N-terminal cleavage/methylation domain-containing protein